MRDINVVLKERFRLTQNEIAMLIGVTRGLFSMYCIKKRSLPLRAVLDLVTLSENITKGEAHFIRKEYNLPDDEKKTRKWLDKELLTTNYKLQLTNKKIKLLQNKRAKCFDKLDLAAILDQAPLDKRMAGVIKTFKMEAQKDLSTHSLQQLTMLELEKASLEMLKKRLESKIKTIGKITEAQLHK